MSYGESLISWFFYIFPTDVMSFSFSFLFFPVSFNIFVLIFHSKYFKPAEVIFDLNAARFLPEADGAIQNLRRLGKYRWSSHDI